MAGDGGLGLSGQGGLVLLGDLDNVHLLTARRLHDALFDLIEGVDLAERQFPLEDDLGLLAATHDPPLQRLHERHGLFHLGAFAELGDRAVERFVVFEGRFCEHVAHQVDILVLPGWEGTRGKNGDAFGLARVERGRLPFGHALGGLGFGTGDVAGGQFDVFARRRRGWVGLWDNWPACVLDRGFLVQDFAPDVLGPVRCDGGDEDRLEFRVTEDQGP